MSDLSAVSASTVGALPRYVDVSIDHVFTCNSGAVAASVGELVGAAPAPPIPGMEPDVVLLPVDIPAQPEIIAAESEALTKNRALSVRWLFIVDLTFTIISALTGTPDQTTTL
jgi:hypothetical protein